MLLRAWRATLGRAVSLDRPLILFGCPRSGTTFAAELLARHPALANVSEAQSVWDPRFLDLEADHALSPDRATPTEIRRIQDAFAFQLWRSRRSRLLNKNPRTSVRLPFVRRVFPDAVWIQLVRDGRDVVASLLEAERNDAFRSAAPFGHFCKPPGWREHRRDAPAARAAWQWRAIVEGVDAEVQRGFPQPLLLRYEDLVRPQDAVAAVWRHAGLEVSPSILRRLPEHADVRTGSWRQRLTADECAEVEAVAGPALARLGYVPDSTPAAVNGAGC
jgi:hypothetical protein